MADGLRTISDACESDAVLSATWNLGLCVQELQRLNTEAEKDRADAKGAAEILQGDLAGLRDRCADLEASLKQTQADGQANADRAAALERELAVKAEALDATSADAGENAQRIADLSGQLQDRDARIQGLSAEAEERQAAAQAAEEELRRQGDAATAEAAGLQKRVAELRADGEIAMKDAEALRKQLEAALAASDGGLARIRDLEAAVAASQDENSMGSTSAKPTVLPECVHAGFIVNGSVLSTAARQCCEMREMRTARS